MYEHISSVSSMRFEKKYLMAFLMPIPTLILGYYLFSGLYIQVQKADKLIVNHESISGIVRFTRKETSFAVNPAKDQHFVYYEFIDERGKRKRSRAFYEQGTGIFNKGQKIEVLVDPSNANIHMPKFRAEALSEEKDNYIFLIILTLWVAFAPSCIFLLIGFLRSR